MVVSRWGLGTVTLTLRGDSVRPSLSIDVTWSPNFGDQLRDTCVALGLAVTWGEKTTRSLGSLVCVSV